jgi:CRISPR-associated protein Cas2
MWLLIIFDLPVTSPEARRSYSDFRNALLEDGFHMIQYSVYARCVPNSTHAETHKKHIKCWIPPEGEVRILFLTDKQYQKSEIYRGKVIENPKGPPKQLSFL